MPEKYDENSAEEKHIEKFASDVTKEFTDLVKFAIKNPFQQKLAEKDIVQTFFNSFETKFLNGRTELGAEAMLQGLEKVSKDLILSNVAKSTINADLMQKEKNPINPTILTKTLIGEMQKRVKKDAIAQFRDLFPKGSIESAKYDKLPIKSGALIEVLVLKFTDEDVYDAGKLLPGALSDDSKQDIVISHGNVEKILDEILEDETQGLKNEISDYLTTNKWSEEETLNPESNQNEPEQQEELEQSQQELDENFSQETTTDDEQEYTEFTDEVASVDQVALEQNEESNDLNQEAAANEQKYAELTDEEKRINNLQSELDNKLTTAMNQGKSEEFLTSFKTKYLEGKSEFNTKDLDTALNNLQDSIPSKGLKAISAMEMSTLVDNMKDLVENAASVNQVAVEKAQSQVPPINPAAAAAAASPSPHTFENPQKVASQVIEEAQSQQQVPPAPTAAAAAAAASSLPQQPKETAKTNDATPLSDQKKEENFTEIRKDIMQRILIAARAAQGVTATMTNPAAQNAVSDFEKKYLSDPSKSEEYYINMISTLDNLKDNKDSWSKEIPTITEKEMEKLSNKIDEYIDFMERTVNAAEKKFSASRTNEVKDDREDIIAEVATKIADEIQKPEATSSEINENAQQDVARNAAQIPADQASPTSVNKQTAASIPGDVSDEEEDILEQFTKEQPKATADAAQQESKKQVNLENQSQVQPATPEVLPPSTDRYNFLVTMDKQENSLRKSLENEGFKIDKIETTNSPTYFSAKNEKENIQFEMHPPHTFKTQDESVKSFIKLLEAHQKTELGQKGVMPTVNTSDKLLPLWKKAAETVYPNGGVHIKTPSMQEPIVTQKQEMISSSTLSPVQEKPEQHRMNAR